MLLQNKVALVTGGGHGIGRATAVTFAKEGARVAVADIRLRAARRTVDEINELGLDAIAIEVDVACDEDVRHMVQTTVAEWGGLHCASNNAAMGGGFDSIEKVTMENWDRCHNVSLKGVMLCLQQEIPAMLASGGGAIVNIASLSGVRGQAMQAPYSAAKGGVIALTRTAAAECAQQGVRVNAINPGGIRTGALTDYFAKVPEAEDRTLAIHAMRRLGEPEEVADAAAYLCSDRASFITGHSLDVDGGIMVNPHDC